MVCVGRLLLSCKWCKSMTSQLPLCNVKRDHEYLPTYLPTYLVRTITYCDLPPNERTEQSSTEQNWFESDRWMKSIHSFACFILSSFPAAPITTLLLSLRFLCAIFVRSFGCGDAVAEALWMRCVFPPSPAFHTGTVLSFFFFSPNPLSFRNCLFFLNSPCFSF